MVPGKNSVEGRAGSPAPGNDAELIPRYLAGEPAAFEAIEGWVVGHLRGRYPRLADHHEDLCQTVHTRLVANLRGGRFEGRSELRHYVGGITHRVAIDRLRVLYRTRAFVGASPESDPEAPDNPYRDVEVKDEAALQRRVLFSLPAHCRQLWKLVFVDELSCEEVGARLATPPGTIKSRLWRCRQKAMSLLRRMRRATLRSEAGRDRPAVRGYEERSR